MIKKNTIKPKATDFSDYLAKDLKNSNNRKLFDEYGRQLEIAYQILQLRKQKNISQAVLAKRIGSTQSNIARMERGNQNFTISLLDKVAGALGAELNIKLS